MGVRLDQIDFTTLFEGYKNYDNDSATLNISGSVASLVTVNFSTTIPYDRAGTRADLYLDGNNTRVLANAGSRAATDVYQPVSTEIFSVLISYSATDITVIVSIFNNTGGSLALTPQTITASAVLYDLPISALT